MPPRLNKRQQRELEELEALNQHVEITKLADDDAELSPDVMRLDSPKGGFALLVEDEVDDDALGHSEEEGKPTTKKKKNKRKKKPAGTPQINDTNDGQHTPAAPSKGKNKPINAPIEAAFSKKKGKQKAASKGDDLDQALAELALKYPDMQTQHQSHSATTSSTLQTFRSLLSVQQRHLDADAEMRRFFGSKVINAAQSSSSSSSAPQPRIANARSILTKPKRTWPPSGMRDGLSMRALTESVYQGVDEERANQWIQNNLRGAEKWFTIEHSPSYRHDQAQFLLAVKSLDANKLFKVLAEAPWHVDTLLQIAEVYHQHDDYTASSDLIDRAIFSFEKCFTGAFNVTSGASRLDFCKVENRALFLALHRLVTYLERRGCMRTAFEFARLLWALDPWRDPHGALLHLDFLAAKAEEREWFIEIDEIWPKLRNESPEWHDLRIKPGWKWGKALILKGSGDTTSATEALKDAILCYPEVLVVLGPLIGLSLPSNVRWPSVPSRWEKSYEHSSAIAVLCQLYAHRCISLWKIPENLAWLSATLDSLTPQLVKGGADMLTEERSNFQSNLTPSLIQDVIRHAIVSDLKPLGMFMGPLMAEAHLAYDPVPPSLRPGCTTYDDEYFRSAKRKQTLPNSMPRHGRGGPQEGALDPVEFMTMLETVLHLDEGAEVRNDLLDALNHPSAQEVTRYMVRWANGHPEFAAQYPNALAFLRMPVEERPGPVAAPAENEDQGIPAVGIPDTQDDGELEQDDDDSGTNESENEEQVPILPIRIARGLMNMFWGGNEEADEGSESEHEELPGNIPPGID